MRQLRLTARWWAPCHWVRHLYCATFCVGSLLRCRHVLKWIAAIHHRSDRAISWIRWIQVCFKLIYLSLRRRSHLTHLPTLRSKHRRPRPRRFLSLCLPSPILICLWISSYGIFINASWQIIKHCSTLRVAHHFVVRLCGLQHLLSLSWISSNSTGINLPH